MELSFQYWYMLPISIVIATIVMSSGMGGAVFFSPIFILGLSETFPCVNSNGTYR